MLTPPSSNLSQPSLPALILAAGASHRYGGAKLAATWQGTTLLAHSATVLADSGASPIYAVVGAHAQTYRDILRDSDVICLECADWQKGMGASLAFAVRQLRQAQPNASGVLVALGDQPYVTRSHMRALRETHAQSPGTVIASAYANTIGVPCVWPRQFWPELIGLQGDRGGRDILLAHAADLIALPCPDAARDLDHREDFLSR